MSERQQLRSTCNRETPPRARQLGPGTQRCLPRETKLWRCHASPPPLIGTGAWVDAAQRSRAPAPAAPRPCWRPSPRARACAGPGHAYLQPLLPLPVWRRRQERGWGCGNRCQFGEAGANRGQPATNRALGVPSQGPSWHALSSAGAALKHSALGLPQTCGLVLLGLGPRLAVAALLNRYARERLRRVSVARGRGGVSGSRAAALLAGQGHDRGDTPPGP